MTRLEPAIRFVPGYVGLPGQRTFYFEVEQHDRTSWFLLEKVQVAAFAAEAGRLLVEAGFQDAGRHLDPGPIREPDDVAFRVGELRIVYDESAGLVEITLLAVGEPEDEDQATVRVTPAQLDAAVRLGAEAVGAGRPFCPDCGLAIDPEGHACPTTNGDLRGHRP